MGEAVDALGGIVAVKIRSPDTIHKSDLGGVALNLATPEAARAAADAMLVSIHSMRPDTRLEGFTVDEMVHRPYAIELIVGLVGLARDLGAIVTHDDGDMTKVCIALSLLPSVRAA